MADDSTVTNSNGGQVDETLTIEKLVALHRQIEVERDAADLDMFLSDDWPVYKILRDGGVILQAPDGTFYAVARSLLDFRYSGPVPPPFPGRFR